jgi:predicted deacylase
LWLTAALHGDELNGVEIIRQVLEAITVDDLRGAVVAVPIVNVFGFIQQLRYLPDRRDLNRSFPGARTGSLASRLAYLLMSEVVANCTHGIDLHTGSNHRSNLPQIRADLDDPATRALATAFGTRVIIHARTRDGSLRRAAAQAGKTVLLYEGGEALRFDHDAIEAGVAGVMRAMRALGMLAPEHASAFRDRDRDGDREPPTAILRTRWLRARRGGILRMTCRLGDHVIEGQPLATVGDAFGRGATTLRAPKAGIVIGQTQNPLVNQGDALINLGLLG